MQLKLMTSVCAVALGLAFAPAAWANGGTDIEGNAVAVDGSSAAIDNSETESEFEARNSFNSQSAEWPVPAFNLNWQSQPAPVARHGQHRGNSPKGSSRPQRVGIADAAVVPIIRSSLIGALSH